MFRKERDYLLNDILIPIESKFSTDHSDSRAGGNLPFSNAPWAKRDPETGATHHLAHHCADVAACFESLAALPTFRSRLESAAGNKLSPSVIARLAVLVFLHDAGKLHPGFQAKGWPVGAWQGTLHGHIQEGAAIFIENRLEAIGIHLCKGDLNSWGIDENLLFSVLAHHGRPFAVDSRGGKRWEAVRKAGIQYDPLVAATEIGGLIHPWFPDAFSAEQKQLPSSAQFAHLFSGLVALADWLGSDQRFFPFVPGLDPNYMQMARRQAQETVARIGLDVSELRRSIVDCTNFSEVTGFREANAQQELIGGCPPSERLLILEAETGSGKTEAAFWRFARLMEAGLVDSLYFALPTRSAAVQLHRRVNTMLKHLFGSHAPEAVLAVPGYLRAGEASGEALPHWRVLWNDEGSVAEDTLVARWAAEGSKRFLAATVAVGTVDQAMLAALCVKHSHLRSAALSRSLLVIDEVHASDSYMTEVQNHLLKTHLSYGGHALLMSATLGSRARAKWLGTKLPSYEAAIAAPYPIVWGTSASTHIREGNVAAEKSVTMTLLPSMAAAAAAQLAISEARNGARVLVIRNTVEAAIGTWTAVRETGEELLLLTLNGGPALHHGRFAPEDRRMLDKAVEAALSANARTCGGVIVIGTQTLEQSLDIDADVLITDLCPVDVLLQRIGRLHRRVALPRPEGFEVPTCYVLSPEKGLAPLLKPAFENGLGAWKGKTGVLNGIYRDLSMLELTRRLLVEHPAWRIPSMNRLLVESATHPDQIHRLHQELGSEWSNYWNLHVGGEIADKGAARNVLLPIQTPFADVQFPTDEERIRTRLGEEGATVTFTEPVKGPFGEMIRSLIFPAHWSHGMQTREQLCPTVSEGVISLTIGDCAFAYDRRGIMRTRQ